MNDWPTRYRLRARAIWGLRRARVVSVPCRRIPPGMLADHAAELAISPVMEEYGDTCFRAMLQREAARLDAKFLAMWKLAPPTESGKLRP